MSVWLHKFKAEKRSEGGTAADRNSLITKNIAKIETAYAEGIALGHKCPMVLVLNLNDPNARWMCKHINGVSDEEIERVRVEINAQKMMPTAFAVMDREQGINLLEKFQAALHEDDKRNAPTSVVVENIKSIDLSEIGHFWAVAISFGKQHLNLKCPRLTKM